MKLSTFVHFLSQRGQHCFTLDEALAATELSKTALLVAIRRLRLKKEIASPYRGFYLIIPPPYQVYGCLPAEQFVPDLMRYLKLPYYVGILTAAQYHGAAHQKAQQFQVMSKKYLPPIKCGQIHIVFVVNQKVDTVPTQNINTATGYLAISTAEATAIDLLQYPRRSGGINNIATVLTELVEVMSAEKLEACVDEIQPEVVTIQRLGYCLDCIDALSLANVLHEKLQDKILRTRPLVAGISSKGSVRNKKWELFINYNMEPDL